MSAARSRPDFFTTARPFFHEVLKLKASARLLDEQRGSLTPADVAARVRAMQNSLLSLLRHEPGHEPVGDEVRYLLAAFADDVFTSLVWAGQSLWQAESLEGTLYQSRTAGTRIFERIQALLQRNQPADVPLATVYLAALSFGYTGRHGTPEAPPVRRAREDLALVLTRHDPVPAPYSLHVCPDAYRVTARPSPVQSPRRFGWGRAVAAGMLGFLVLSHLMWLYITGDLGALTARVLTLGRP